MFDLQQASAVEPLTEREKAVHVLTRFSFGYGPDDVENVMKVGAESWLRGQMRDTPASGSSLGQRLRGMDTLFMTPAEVRGLVERDGKVRDLSPKDQEARKKLERVPRNELIQAVLFRAIYNPHQTKEVACDFWRNHLNVSFTKGQQSFPLIPHYEQTVLRDNVFGDFGAMLRASAKHPAMLQYLDNHLSRRPPTDQELAEVERRTKRKTGSKERAEEAAQIAAQRGLNENYARELMELHTLGVDNYYRQKDVVAVAEALTGWTFNGGRRGSYEFEFKPGMHVKGDKRVLGKRLKEDASGGPGQGEDVLTLLLQHKGTGDFLATKMVRYFVADEPPRKLVKAVAKTYKKSGGNIPAMFMTIIESDEFWRREHFRAKFKTPWEYVLSALRITGADVTDARKVLSWLQTMGQPLYHCDDPTGWYETADRWLDPGIMALRWQFAIDLAGGKLRGVKIPDSFWERIPTDGVHPRFWQRTLTKLILPAGAGERTRAALSAVTSKYLAREQDPVLSELGPDLLALLLGSPEFQQQ